MEYQCYWRMLQIFVNKNASSVGQQYLFVTYVQSSFM